MAEFRSQYGAAGPVTAAQRAAEEACGRAAAHGGVTLPQRFWQQDAWKKAFLDQVRAANRLLKLYDPEALFAALRNNPRVRSLAPAFVSGLVAAEQARVDSLAVRAEEAAPVTPADAGQAPRQGVKKAGSVRSKLQGL